MKIEILTLFPEMFKGPFDESMLKIAEKKGLATIEIHNLRKWTHDRHRTVDDKPFGGGPGPEFVREYDWMNCRLNNYKLRAKKSKCPINPLNSLLFQVIIGF